MLSSGYYGKMFNEENKLPLITRILDENTPYTCIKNLILLRVRKIRHL